MKSLIQIKEENEIATSKTPTECLGEDKVSPYCTAWKKTHRLGSSPLASAADVTIG